MNNEGITRVWQKWRFRAPQTHLWLIKVWFSASTFVLKIGTMPSTKKEGVSLGLTEVFCAEISLHKSISKNK
jgi:hypothetical protein